MPWNGRVVVTDQGQSLGRYARKIKIDGSQGQEHDNHTQRQQQHPTVGVGDGDRPKTSKDRVGSPHKAEEAGNGQ